VTLFAPVKVVGRMYGGFTDRRCARFLAPADAAAEGADVALAARSRRTGSAARRYFERARLR